MGHVTPHKSGAGIKSASYHINRAQGSCRLSQPRLRSEVSRRNIGHKREHSGSRSKAKTLWSKDRAKRWHCLTLEPRPPHHIALVLCW